MAEEGQIAEGDAKTTGIRRCSGGGEGGGSPKPFFF